jgi:hypothetical protein
MAPGPQAPARPGERSATGFRTEHAQKRGEMRAAGAALEGKAAHTTAPSPEALELQDHWLQVHDPNRSGLGNGSVPSGGARNAAFRGPGRRKIAAP